MPATGGGTAAAGVTLPSLSEIRDWDTSHLVTAARQWGATAEGWEESFSAAQRAAASPGGTDWHGQAAEAVQARALEDLYRVRGWADSLDAAAQAARAGAMELQSARQQVLDSVRRAEAAGFEVHDDLSLSTRQGVTAAEYPAKLAEGQALSAEINARALHLAALDAEVAGRITAAVAPLGEIGFAESPVQLLDAPLGPQLSPGGGVGEPDPTTPKTWQDMLLPAGPASPEAEDAAPTLQEHLFPQGGAVPAEQTPKNLDQALESTAPGLGAAMERQRQAALSRVPSVQDLKADPEVVAAARGILEAQGVAPQDMDAALDRFLQDTQRLGEYLALNPTMPQPDPVPQPAPGFVDGFRDRWFANEATLKSLFGTGDSKSPGVLESWQALLGGLQETIYNPVGAVKDEIDRVLNAPSAAHYFGEWAADGAQSAGSAVVFGPETLAARAALGDVTHEMLDSTTSGAKSVTDLDGVPGLGSGPHAPSTSSGHTPTPLPPDSPLFENYQPTPPGSQFTTADGGLIYPDDSLPTKPYALPGTVIPDVQLPEGTVVDRFGHPGGSWMSPEGVPFAERALPPSSVDKPYYQYVVADPAKLPPGYTIERSLAAPWFGQPGGGVQYRILDPDGNNASIQDLLDAQYLRRVDR